MRYKRPLNGLKFRQCDNILDNFYRIFSAKYANIIVSQLLVNLSTRLFDSMTVVDE